MFAGCSLDVCWIFVGCLLDFHWNFVGCSMDFRLMFVGLLSDVRWIFIYLWMLVGSTPDFSMFGGYVGLLLQFSLSVDVRWLVAGIVKAYHLWLQLLLIVALQTLSEVMVFMAK